MEITASSLKLRANAPEGRKAISYQLEGKRPRHWANDCCHNPCLRRIGDQHVLFFQTKGRDRNDRCIGYATAPSAHGPWTLAKAPLDLGYNVTNPSVWIEEEGRIRMAFRRPDMRLAIAEADAFYASFRIVISDLCPGVALEDPFLYKIGSEYHLLVEDNVDKLTGKVRHGAHLVSENGRDFSLFEGEIEAYSHTAQWQDGGETHFDRRERPWLVIQQSKPTHLVTGVLLGTQAWSLVQPLGDAIS